MTLKTFTPFPTEYIISLKGKIFLMSNNENHYGIPLQSLSWVLFVCFLFHCGLHHIYFSKFCSQVLLLSKHLETVFVEEVTSSRVTRVALCCIRSTCSPPMNIIFTDQIKCSLIIKELNVLEKHLREKVWLADSLLNLPIAGSLADSELSFGRFSTKNMNNFLMSASLE